MLMRRLGVEVKSMEEVSFGETTTAEVPFGGTRTGRSLLVAYIERRGPLVRKEKLEGLHEKYSSTCRLVTYEEVLTITSNFSSENLIREGGNIYVYRGDLPDGRELAVKILKPCLDVFKEFILEIEVITSVHHKNIDAVNVLQPFWTGFVIVFPLWMM